MAMVLSSVDLDSVARRMKKGTDQKAYQEFFRYFGPRLRSFYIRRCVPDAEDMAMELLSDIAWDKVHHYSESGKFKAWVRKVALNRYYDWKRRAEDMLPLHDELSAASLYSNAPPSDPELDALVQRAVAKLSKLDREIIRLHYQGECQKLEAIGLRLRVKSDTIRSRHHRALKKLQRELEGIESIRSRYLT